MENFVSPVTIVILAGGLGTRIGGNKGLQILNGKSLVAWVYEAVKYNQAEVLINANALQDEYRQLGCRVIKDHVPDLPGPLAGLQAALNSARTEYVMTVPCDTPFLPKELMQRLIAALNANNLEAAVVKTAGFRHPTVALYKKSVLPKLDAYLASGKRKVNDWLDSLHLSEVEFENAGDFENINTQEDLARIKQVLLEAESCRVKHNG